MKKILLLIIMFNFTLTLNANTIICSKFNIKCKANKIFNETKEFQKNSFADGKKQITGTTKSAASKLTKK